MALELSGLPEGEVYSVLSSPKDRIPHDIITYFLPVKIRFHLLINVFVHYSTVRPTCCFPDDKCDEDTS